MKLYSKKLDHTVPKKLYRQVCCRVFLAHVETRPSSGGNTDVAQLAASIKHRMLECEACEIDCLGPESIFRSLSAMHLAMVFVKRERAESRTLCLRPEEMHVASKPESMDPSIDANENADESVQEAWQRIEAVQKKYEKVSCICTRQCMWSM